MDSETGYLPIEENCEVTSLQGAVDVIRAAAAKGKALYPIGGGTQLGMGGPPRRPGVALRLARLNRVVDYPSRDLTVTVEAGMTLGSLQELLASQNQWLPLSVPEPHRATIGGLLSTDWPSLRQTRYGSARDFLLAAKAVDGTGCEFNCGARVVKNAAGYNLCRLLVGSFGGLAVLTEVTLMVRPRPEASLFLVTTCPHLEAAENFVRALGPRITEVATAQLLAGQVWMMWHEAFKVQPATPQPLWLVIGLEGSVPEVAALEAEVTPLLAQFVSQEVLCLSTEESREIWQCLEGFSGLPSAIVDKVSPSGQAPVLLQVRTMPDRTLCTCRQLVDFSEALAWEADLSAGLVWVWLEATKEDFPKIWNTLYARMAASEGKVVVAGRPATWDLSPQMVWGEPPDGNGVILASRTARKIAIELKKRFDPQGILNPGRLPWS
ncbi:MAG: FAD-binding oxidoreductase [Thermoguttaceae bacterium]|nr:FAD-binding oxidoreductase [Thermoguttaceae bacterium]